MNELFCPARNVYSHPRNEFLNGSSFLQRGAGQQRVMVRSTERWREPSAPEKVVYAKNQRRFASQVRNESRTGSDSPKLLHQSGNRSPVSRKSRIRWPHLATAGRSLRPATQRVAVSDPAGLPTVRPAARSGLHRSAPPDAAQPLRHPATALGRVPREAKRRLRL